MHQAWHPWGDAPRTAPDPCLIQSSWVEKASRCQEGHRAQEATTGLSRARQSQVALGLQEQGRWPGGRVLPLAPGQRHLV
jgi:hypothetical protein